MGAELETLTLDDLRARRDAVRERADLLSYRRRLLHAQMDLVEAAATTTDHEEFDAMIAEVLSDRPESDGEVRAVSVEQLDDDQDVAALPADLLDLDDEERASLLARLRAREQEVSTERRGLLDDLDQLLDELVRRFRQDGVDARSLLSEEER